MEENTPEAVVDQEAYKEFLKLSRNPILSTKKEITCSDGTIINIAIFPHLLLKKIEHLPVEEQNKVMARKQIYFNLNNKMTAVKRKAFGKVQGRQAKGSGLLYDKQLELVEYFGRMFSIDEVTKIVNKEWGIPVNRNEVTKFRQANAQEIEKKIDIFKASYSDIRLGVKRSRLEELVFLYNRQKDKYMETERREDYKLLLTTLEHIRKEAEGDRLTINGKLDVSYEINMHQHLKEEVYKTMNLKEIILGRVAARMGVNPIKLIFSLNNSFYNKFSNVTGNFDEDVANGTDIVYPSQMNYDFERIKKESVKRDQDIQDAVIIEETTNEKSLDRAEEIKKALLEKLKSKQANNLKVKAKVNADADIYGKQDKKDSNRFTNNKKNG